MSVLVFCLLASDTLRWDTGPHGSFAFPGGNYVEVAARLVPPVPGIADSVIFFHPLPAQDTVVLSLYEDSTIARPGALLFRDTFVVPDSGWFSFALPGPVPFAGGQDLWVSASYLSPAVASFFGVDSGPAVHHGGCFFTRDGSHWEEAWRYGIDMDFNWCLGLIYTPEARPRDVAAEGVVLSPPFAMRNFPVEPQIFFQNYSDTIVHPRFHAFIYDSLWNEVYHEIVDTVTLYPYGYYKDGDTVSFPAVGFSEGLYHIVGVSELSGDTLAQNDTTGAITAVVSFYEDFEGEDGQPTDLGQEGWWVSGDGWMAYNGYQAWAHWQEFPVGSWCYAHDDLGYNALGALVTPPVVLSSGSELFFYTATDLAPGGTGTRKLVFRKSSGFDTVDVSGFSEKAWTLLHYPVPVTSRETVRVEFLYDSDDEWFLDEVALSVVDTVMSAQDASGRSADGFSCPAVIQGILPLRADAALALSMYDASGRRVMSWDLPGAGFYRINLLESPPGVYYLLSSRGQKKVITLIR